MRTLLGMALALAGLSLAGCGGSSATPPAGPQTTTFPVATGASDATGAFEVLRYYPSSIVIDAGDTLSWNIASGSPHIIALVPSGQTAPVGPPSIKPAGGASYDGTAFTSSGLIAQGTTYSLRFPTPGTYTVVCLVHQPEMRETVTVQPAGASRPLAAAQITALAAVDGAADVNAARAVPASFPFTPGGTHLALGLAPHTSPPSVLSIYRFLDGPSLDAALTVAVGTTLTWSNVSNVPHTVVFPVAGQPIPATFNDFGPPIGGSVYDGTALTSSGLLPPGANYSLTLDHAGVFVYSCTLHDTQGMQSSVTVI
jgi:plastocyanin